MAKKKGKRPGRAPQQAEAAALAPKGSTRRRLWIALAMAGLVTAAGAFALWWRAGGLYSPNLSSGSLRNDNVLLITLDTTRADHLPMYGYGQVKTPGLERLAAKSFVFEDAIAQVPLTLPSHTTILTGQLPIAHGVRDNDGFSVDPGTPTLATILKDKGYATAAFVSAFVLDSRWGLNRGFDEYFDRFNSFQEVNRDEIQRKAEETESEVERWLPANKDRPFFCWVHFYDPHEPYDPPEPYSSLYAGNRYDGEIAYMDRSVGNLLAKLDELQLSERTLVIVTGDHGEGLGEHDESTHGMFLYGTTLHVPLLIRVPGGANKRIPGVVRHIDLAPTVLDLLGFPAPAQMQGTSLIPVINGAEPSKRPAYSESEYARIHYGWSALKSITTGKYAYIESPKPELFEREKDPKQLRNLIHDEESVARGLGDQLRSIVQEFSRAGLQGPRKMDPDTEEKLRSLGYLGSPVPATASSATTDPKDKSGLVRALSEGMKALARRDFQGALRLVLPVIEADKNIVDAHLVAGSAYLNLQQYGKAQDELLKVLAVKPDDAMAIATLATSYEGMGSLKEAERWYLKVLQVEKEHSYAIVKLASLYRRLNEPSKAEEYFARAVKPVEDSLESTHEPRPRSKLYAARAEMYFGAGKLADAERDLRAAITLTPRAPDLHFNLAQVYEGLKDVPDAIASYQLETEIAPSNFGACLNLGLLHFQAGHVEAAAACFQRLLQLRPGEPHASFLLAETYARTGNNLEQALQLVRQGLSQMPDYKHGYVLMAEIYRKLGRAKEADEAAAMGR